MQVTLRDGPATEPLALMERAALRAAEDADAPTLLKRLQRVAVIDAM